MTSVIPSLDTAPSNSRLHNVRQAVNSLDRVRWVWPSYYTNYLTFFCGVAFVWVYF